MFLLVDYGKVLGSSANELKQNSDASCKEEYSTNFNCFVVDSSRFHLTFVALNLCRSFVNNS